MSAQDMGGGAGGPAPGVGGAGPGGEPSEEELRAAYEAELSRISTTDMLAQAAVSLLNLGARRLAPPQGPDAAQRDLEQARDAIDGVSALLDILQRRIPGELAPLRDALSQLQMAYAREAQATPAAAPPPSGGTGAGTPGAGSPGEPSRPPGAPATSDPTQRDDGPRGPGPAESSGRLWVPGR